jgi:hypothetical protein
MLSEVFVAANTPTTVSVGRRLKDLLNNAIQMRFIGCLSRLKHLCSVFWHVPGLVS